MLFNSYEFIFCYLPIVLIVYYLCAHYLGSLKAKWFLIIASLAFYSYWDITNLPVLLASIAFNYCVGNRLQLKQSKKTLAFGVVVNLAFLGYFKYANFFLDNITLLAGSSFRHLNIVLPLGISFFTFTQTAYLVDVYRGETKKYSKSDYLLFVTIFPHLIAGPILYHKDMIPQFADEERYRFNWDNFAQGITWFVVGLFKKVVIADWIAGIVNILYKHADQLSMLEGWCASLGYTTQLYFDFSGYSEMAIGLGLMLNYNLPWNFNAPYKSTSIIEFWRKWHMTLSAFLKNYLYIPCGGNRGGHHMRNIMITMGLGGLWHGAGWTFIFWGLMHGIGICVNHLWRKFGFRLPSVLGWLLTFNFVNVAWIFFRAESFEQSVNILRSMVDFTSFAWPYSRNVVKWLPSITYSDNMLLSSNDALWVILLVLFVVIVPGLEMMMRRYRPKVVYALLLSVMFVYTVANLNKITTFLYFQF